MSTIDYKCPTCSARLLYNPEINSWKCDYCSQEFSLEDLAEKEEFADLEVTETMDVDEYTCSSCGAKIITDENTVATFCVYCGNTAIIKNRLTGVLKPHSVIPFRTTKEVAVQEFMRSRYRKPFAPKSFFDKKNIEKMMPVYIPFWLFDYTAYGKINAVVSESSSSKHIINKHKYDAECKGTANFVNVPADASRKYNDKVMDSIEPFDFSELKDFSPAYLSGFFAEKYDIGKNAVNERAEERIKNTFEECLKEKAYKRYETVYFSNAKISLKRTAGKYVFLPVWLLNIEYKGKKRLFAMNGQTGAIVGATPISWKNVLLWFIGIFVMIFVAITGVILLANPNLFVGSLK